MHILFITSTRLGDAVLSTGVLNTLLEQYPGALVTVVCGPEPAPVFYATPGVVRIITLVKRRWNIHWLSLWPRLMGTYFGLVVDLRNSALSRFLARGQLIVNTHRDKTRHVVLELGMLLRSVAPPPAPRLHLCALSVAKARTVIPHGKPILAMAPGANWSEKQWPVDRFAELAERVLGPDGVMANGCLALFGAPREMARAEAVRAALSAALQHRVINLTGQGSVMDAAAALSLCHAFVGNDSGLMHLADALRLPVVGLFGPTDERRYGPWNGVVVRGAARDFESGARTMSAITVEAARIGLLKALVKSDDT